MRPRRLALENFTAFRGVQPPLDFTDLALFAISGPTGSGKSSLLDAILFALYGRIPRLGASVREAISQGRDRMAVTFDFESAGRLYRVARVATTRTSGSKAILEDVTGGDEVPLADGVTDVNAKVLGIVGLGYEAFTQAVILPQGDFQRFLKGEPASRRTMLRDLLRLQVFETMKRRAGERANLCAAEVEAKAGVLAREYGEASADEVAATEDTLARRARDNAALRRTVESGRTDVAELRVRHGLTRELREKRAEASRLARDEPRIRALEAELDAARRAAPLVPRIEAAEAAASRLDAAARSRDEADARFRDSERAHALAVTALEAALAAAEAIPGLEARLRALDQVTGLLGPRDEAASRAARLAAELRQREEACEEATRARERALQDAVAKAAEVEAAAEAVRCLRYDAARHGRLEAARDAAATLAARRADLSRVREDARAVASTVATARAQNTDALRELDAAAASLAKTERARADAETALRRAQDDHAATHLRSTLRKGEPCPVCEHRVARLPEASSAPLLDEIVERNRAAAADEQAARRADAAARERRARASQALEQAEAAESRAQVDGTAAEAAFAEAEQALLASLPELAPPPSATAKPGPRRLAASAPLHPERLLREWLGEATERRGRHDTAAKARDAAEKLHEEARHALQRAEDRLTGQAGARQDLARRCAEAEAEAAEYAAKVAAVTTASDPLAERLEVEARRTALTEAADAARDAERQTGLAVASVRTQAEAAHQARDVAGAAAEAALGLCAEALRAARFADGAAARAAWRPPEHQAEIDATIADHNGRRRAVAERVAQLAHDVAGREVEDDALGGAEAALGEAERALEEGTAEEVRLGERLVDLRRRAEAARVLTAEIATGRRRQGLYGRLADDLQSNNFQDYLLEETFRELLAGASQRLLELSGRYTFELHRGSFHVLDHDNARERRRADTLSGGETFLASLALALELSQQIQRAAGAVHLDSLFIDEGFGTLDSETLETIAGALESLPVGGRMVGLITHLPELTDRLPARILVEKRPEGSRAVVRA